MGLDRVGRQMWGHARVVVLRAWLQEDVLWEEGRGGDDLAPGVHCWL